MATKAELLKELDEALNEVSIARSIGREEVQVVKKQLKRADNDLLITRETLASYEQSLASSQAEIRRLDDRISNLKHAFDLEDAVRYTMAEKILDLTSRDRE